MQQTMLLRDTNNSKALNLAKLFLGSKEYDTAEKHLNDYLNRHPDCAVAWKMMSHIYEERGDPELALQYYQKGLEARKHHNVSLDASASPNNVRVSSLSRNSTTMNLSSNSTLDSSLVQQSNGNLGSDVKIDYSEIEKIIDTKITPLFSSVKSIQDTVIQMQTSHKQLFTAQCDLQKIVTDSSKNHKATPIGQDIFVKLSNLMNEQLNSLKKVVAPLESNISALNMKHENVLQRLDALKAEMTTLTTVVQENMDRDEDYDEDYEEDDDDCRDNSPPISTGPKQNLCDMFKKSVNNWTCPTCETSNDEKDLKCVCCEENNPNVKATPVPATSASKFSFGLQPQTMSSGQTFVVPPANPTPTVSTKSATPPKPSLFSQAPAEMPKFGQVSLPPSGSIFGQAAAVNGFGASPIGLNKPQDATKSSPFSGNNFGNFFNKSDTASSTCTLFAKASDVPPKPAFPTAGSVFGAPTNTSSIFNAKPQEPASNTSSIFNTKPQEPPSGGNSMFGASNTLFGGAVFGSGGQTNFSFSNISFTSPKKEEPQPQEESNDDKHPEEHEPEGVYKLPNVKLPENYNTVTGEEDEKVLFENRGKLFVHRENEFKERGLGMFKVLQNEKTGKIRILMRREHIFKVCLNVRLEDISNLEIADNKFLRFSALDFSEGEAAAGVFLLRFSNIELLKNLKQMLETLENNPASVVSEKETKHSEDPDIEFVGEVAPTPEQLKTIKELKLPMNFYSNRKPCKGCRGCRDEDIVYQDISKTNGQNTNGSSSDFFTNLVSNLNIPSATVDNINTSRGMENGGDEEHVVTTDYTSAKSKLLPTNFVVHTGEEEDEVLFNERAKLYRYTNGEYKERGIGPMKILKNKNNGIIRLLMRREQVHKVVCNHGIKNLNVKLHNTNNRAVNWVARDFSDSNEGTDEVFLLRFRSEEQAKNFVNKIQELQAN